MNDISGIRQEYNKSSIDINEVAENPFEQFTIWFNTALKSKQFYDPTAFALSTCGKDNIPHSRVVLLKGYNEEGFTFFTNYNSKKGENISENENISMLFFWDKLEKQIRVNGKAIKISAEKSDDYFYSRPYESQIGAIASNQSDKLESKSELEQRIVALKNEFPEKPIRPTNWGGYQIKPFYFEFWQGRESRLHDRVAFELENDSWNRYLLNP